MAAQLSGVSTTPSSFMSSADLLRVHSIPSSRSLMKKLNKTGPSTDPWGHHCGVSGRTGTYFEQPRHSEYGLHRFVVAQASSSTGLKAFLRPAVGKQTFLRPVAGKQTFLRLAVGKTIIVRPAAGKQSFYEY